MAECFRVAMGVLGTLVFLMFILNGVAAEAPQIVSVKGFDELEEGQRLLIVCAIRKGTLPISFAWRKNNAVLVPSGSLRILHLDDYQEQLQIQKLSVEDTGNYTCAAKNLHGSDEISVPVVMKFAPRWKTPSDAIPVSTTAGENVVIDCRVLGFPQPTIKIWKGDTLLEHLEKRQREPGLWEFPTVPTEVKGDFTCEATNDLGTVRKTVKISLTGEI